ncbi:MAG: hypothetical protein KAY37_09280 [Phycisphaerae bacterium]|nr:hypothetical protein [Phycisphaerae bacterium]
MLLSPLTRVNFQLAGGWRQNMLIAGAYLALVVLISNVAYRSSEPGDRNTITTVLLTIITVVQGLIVLLLAPGAVRKAVLRDFQTGMIDSHRVTPLSGLNLVLGYLTGPTSQALLLYGVGLLLGGYFAGAYGQSLGFTGLMLSGWYFSQLCMLTLALLLSALVLLSALASDGKTNIMALLVIVGVLGGWFLLPFVPGLALLLGVMSAGLLIQMLGRTGPITSNSMVTAWAMVLQVALTLILLRAACRKIRAPDRALFSIRLGLILLTVMGVTLVLGWHFFSDIAGLFGPSYATSAQWFGSTTAFLLVALFPLAAVATERYRRGRVTALTTNRPPAMLDTVDLLPILLTIMTFAVMGLMLPVGLELRLHHERLTVALPLIAAVALSLWTDYACIYITLVRGKRMFWILVLSWATLKGVPLMVEGAAAVIAEMAGQGMEISWQFAGFSPIGTLIVVSEEQNPWPGLAAQLVIAVLGTVLALRLRRKLLPTEYRI